MSSNVEVCNRALQKLGAQRINSLSDGSRNAIECNACYEVIRDKELESHNWGFAITRQKIAADATSPVFGRDNAFTLPSDCLKILPAYPEERNRAFRDWIIEGQKIYTDDEAPLELRYIRRVTNPQEMTASFLEAWATSIAFELCEKIAQSNTKKDRLRQDYESIIATAKHNSSIQNPGFEIPPGSWITERG